VPGANIGSELAPVGRPIRIARQEGASRLTISATARAHLKTVSERSSTILLCARLALQYYGRHPPAAARCRSPRPGRCVTGAGHGLPATRVATGCIRRVPAVGDRVLGPSGCCVVLQGQAAPSDAHTLPYPDVPIDNWKICAMVITDVRGEVLYKDGVPLSSPAMPMRHPASPEIPPPANVDASPGAPSIGPPPQNIKNQGTNPIWHGVCTSRLWRPSETASTSSALCWPLRWRSLPD